MLTACVGALPLLLAHLAHRLFCSWPMQLLLEYGLSVMFTFDFLCTLVLAPSATAYLLSYWGVVEVFSILPGRRHTEKAAAALMLAAAITGLRKSFWSTAPVLSPVGMAGCAACRVPDAGRHHLHVLLQVRGSQIDWAYVLRQ